MNFDFFSSSNIYKWLGSVWISIIGGYLLFYQNMPNPLWVLNIIFQVFFFLSISTHLYNKLRILKPKSFLKYVFLFTLIIALVWVTLSYFIYDFVGGEPFEFHPTDGKSYHLFGAEIAKKVPFIGWFRSFKSVLPSHYGSDDYGFFAYVAMIYHLFGEHILVVRLFNALWIALSSVLIYSISKTVFSKHNYAAFSTALFVATPNFYIYASNHRKEILLILILLWAVNIGLKIVIEGKLRFGTILTFIISLCGLFFMRPLLILILFCALFFGFIESEYYKNHRIKKYVIYFFICFVLLSSLSFLWEYLLVIWQYKDVALESNSINKMRTSGVDVRSYSIWFYLGVSPFAPFPSFVNLPFKENEMFISGAHFIKQYYMFFFFVALWQSIKRKKNLFLLAFIFIYALALAINGYSIDTRFHMIMIPFILILIPQYIEERIKYQNILFLLYTVIYLVLVLYWNYART